MTILEDIKSMLPKDAISEVSYEGSEIILYTKSKEFFRSSSELIRSIVNKVKKRVEVRADPSILAEESTTEELIRNVVPKEAGIKDVYFEPEFAKVVIHTEKPGLVIGKSGETLLQIKNKTLWTPDIKRAPVIDSEVIRSIRKMLHKEVAYRKKFMNELGKKIYSTSKEVEWIRVTALGGFREVGRSCILLQTPQSKVLMDCGLNVNAAALKPFPQLDVPEFRIQDLDAIILTHAHMDHCLPPQTPVIMANGTRKPISDVSEGDEIFSLNFQTGKWETGRCVGKTSTTGHRTVKRIKTPFRDIEASSKHRFFAVRDLEVVETEAQDLVLGDLLPITIVKNEQDSSKISLDGIRRFAKEIGFNSAAKKEKMLILAKRESLMEKEFVPIKSGDLRRIINEARMIGRIHNSPKCTRRTALNLLRLLENRISELRQLEADFEENGLKSIRQALSVSLSSIAKETGVPLYTLQYRESGYVDHIYGLFSDVLKEKLALAIVSTQKNAEKIRKILSLPVVWEPITEIETLENPYSELIDIEVLPHRNFVAENIVVHNSGMVPYLYEYGFKGPLYCSRPTRDLSALLLLDYLQIAQRENKKAPYSSKGIEEMIKHCIPLEYGEVSDISPDMRLTFQNAGHILGSSTVHVHIGDGLYNVLYTGDMKYERTKLFDMTSTDYARAEALIIESTYGSHEDVLPLHRDGEGALIDAVKKTIARGGRVIIPSFAVGRAQDVIAILADSDVDSKMYLDGMLWDATAIHTAYPEFMSRNMQTKILHKGKNPFIDERFKGIGSQKERQEVLNSTYPCVVLATSGMLTGGPAMEYLQHFAADPKNTLLFVGYQAEGTMGRRIQKGWKQLQLDNGKLLDLNLEVVTTQGLSGHSDHRQLLAFIQNLKNKPRKVIVDHGESAKCIELSRMIHKMFKIESVAPRVLETIRLL